MKHKFLLKSMLLLCALIAGSSSVWAAVTFKKITSISEVSEGSSYLFVYVNGNSGMAMSTTQNTNNRGAVNVVITDNEIACVSGAEVITLESTGTENQYYLRGSNGKYLIAVENQNYLKSSATKVDAGKFTFSYSDNVWSITSTLPAGNTSTWNPSQLRCNSSSSLFSCYGTGQKAITLFKEVAIPWETTSNGIDELTWGNIGLPNSSSYTDFSDKNINSTAVYAGKASSGSGKYIQLNNSSPNGIITTTTGGKARKIVIDWNSGNTNGRYVEVYGKNTAYSSGSDLFDNEKKGELIGCIVYGINTELNICADYDYIGLKGSGAIYMNNIKIYWEGDAVSLSDASDYTPTAKDYARVTLDRSFVSGWNGVILPFDITTSVKTALGASDVKALSSATESAGVITLNFADAELPVAAGTPVLVKLNGAVANGDFIMNGVEIKTTSPTTIEKTVAGNTFTLTGTYSSVNLQSSEAYFVSNDKFYHKASGVALTAAPFRAYIVQTDANSAPVMFNLEGNTTGIIEIVTNNMQSKDGYYNLNGQRVAQPTKGLYIVKGKKVIVK